MLSQAAYAPYPTLSLSACRLQCRASRRLNCRSAAHPRSTSVAALHSPPSPPQIPRQKQWSPFSTKTNRSPPTTPIKNPPYTPLKTKTKSYHQPRGQITLPHPRSTISAPSKQGGQIQFNAVIRNSSTKP